MEISEGNLRRLIRESILKETRIQKQDFATFKRSVPSIDKAYYVHWVRQNIYGGILPELHFSDLTPIVGNVMKTENSFNLVDPLGKETIPHYDEWGPVGIVVQGVVTYGEVRDVGATRSQTDSGPRYYPNEDNYDGRHTPGKRFDANDAFKKPAYDLSGDFKGIEPFGIDHDTFLNHIPDFPYSGSEFIVKPQALMGIALHTQSEYPRAYHDGYGPEGTLDEFTDAENIDKIKNIASRLNTPLAIGHEQIGKLFRYLYANNPRVN